ncbi:MAG: response regulator [Elusimicrobiota bacterium]
MKQVKNKRVLIVDDDQDILRLMEALLEGEGYGIIKAEDGSYALEKTILEKPDLILLDIDMPNVNGFEVLERVKENPATKRIPIIMLTASSESHSFEEAVEKKVDRYIAKPFDTKFLMQKIEEVMEEYEKKYRSGS